MLKFKYFNLSCLKQSKNKNQICLAIGLRKKERKMNSEEIFKKITKRIVHVSNCGTARNFAYSEYLKASLEYDSSKKAFYTALELARLDGNVQEDRKFNFKITTFSILL